MTEKKGTRAIDPPMCKLCQTRHWSQDPHVWPKAKKRNRRK